MDGLISGGEGLKLGGGLKSGILRYVVLLISVELVEFLNYIS